MTTEELYKDLSDLEFKVYAYINMYKEDRHGRIPTAEHIAVKINKSDRTVFRALANLKARKLIWNFVRYGLRRITYGCHVMKT